MSRGREGAETTTPSLRWVSATLSKAGHRPEENEDAIAASPKMLRFAVADGATEAWESGPWATCLAKAYVRQPPTPSDFPAWLAAIRLQLGKPNPSGPTPWYAETKRAEGSFATLAGVEFRLNREPFRWTWKAVAVGDSCLFQLRDGCVHQVFPISKLSEFGNRPRLVPSSTDATCPEPEWLAGKAEPGDHFLLATDAVAAHLMSLTASDGWSPVLKVIGGALDAGSPTAIMEWLRVIQATNNDDLSMIAVRIPGKPL